jgi:hypothetical protein
MATETYGLIDGKVEAADRSKRSTKPVYMVGTPDGEFEFSDVPLKNTIYKFKGGSEVPLGDDIKNYYESQKPAKKSKAVKEKETYTQPAAETMEPVDEIKQIKKERKQKEKMSTKKETKPAKKAKKSAPAKKAAPVKKEAKVKTLPRGNNMFLTEAQWKKVDAKLAKDEISFSAFSRGLVLKSIGE